MYQVIKRDGKMVDFDLSKISAAIQKAFDALQKQYNQNIIDMLAVSYTHLICDKIYLSISACPAAIISAYADFSGTASASIIP